MHSTQLSLLGAKWLCTLLSPLSSKEGVFWLNGFSMYNFYKTFALAAVFEDCIWGFHLRYLLAYGDGPLIYFYDRRILAIEVTKSWHPVR